MKIAEIKELIAIITETDVTELMVQREDGSRIRIRRGPQGMIGVPTFVGSAPMVSGGSDPSNPSFAQSAEPSPTPQEDGNYLTSPFVGTFFRASSPEVAAYVEVGQVVKKGQALCIIEAMKIMNEIEAEAAGKVVEILAENGQPVEYGQPLFRIDPLG